MNELPGTARIMVVIPCYRVKKHILDVIGAIGPEVERIYAIDDACPDGSGDLIARECRDPRVVILRNAVNLGVGGAVKRGYAQCMADGADIMVKIDGDGQMEPRLIPLFVAPILQGQADYTKGNRFYDLENLREMPGVRVFGNAMLSMIAKLSTGYWDLFDPANGYTAIHARVAARLPLGRIDDRYFFESDMLFRLNTVRAVVLDIPMDAVYREECSGLVISRTVWEFLGKHCYNLLKRIFYNYYLRGMTIASLELPIGLMLIVAGLLYGVHGWSAAARAEQLTPTGTVMVVAVSLLMGVQFVLSFLNFDMTQVPGRPIHTRLQQARDLATHDTGPHDAA